MAERVLFCRVAWMENYKGVTREREAPRGGGQWVTDGNVPWESYNFYPVDEYVFGYARPAVNQSAARIERIDPAAEDHLDDVRVIFFAAGPKGQVIVGWYESAQVYRDALEGPGDARDGFLYFFRAPIDRVALLPLQDRTFPIPRGKDGTGQSNWTYLLDEDGQPKKQPWLYEAIEYTKVPRPSPRSGNPLRRRLV